MSTEHAYSTSNPAIVAAYREAVQRNTEYGPRMRADVEALGAGPRIYMRNGSFDEPNRITALEQKDGHIPDGWRFVRGHLEPRRGKPGEQARQWLADRQPADARHALTSHGLPRAVWVPASNGSFSYRIVSPDLFEHDGTLWACYEIEPGTSGSGFDEERCTWTPRKLSEFHAAREVFEASRELSQAGAR